MDHMSKKIVFIYDINTCRMLNKYNTLNDNYI